MSKAQGITAEAVIKAWMAERLGAQDETADTEGRHLMGHLGDPTEARTRDAICDWLRAVTEDPEMDFYLVAKRWLEVIAGHDSLGACTTCEDWDAMLHFYREYRHAFAANPTPWSGREPRTAPHDSPRLHDPHRGRRASSRGAACRAGAAGPAGLGGPAGGAGAGGGGGVRGYEYTARFSSLAVANLKNGRYIQGMKGAVMGLSLNCSFASEAEKSAGVEAFLRYMQSAGVDVDGAWAAYQDCEGSTLNPTGLSEVWREAEYQGMRAAYEGWETWPEASFFEYFGQQEGSQG